MTGKEESKREHKAPGARVWSQHTQHFQSVLLANPGARLHLERTLKAVQGQGRAWAQGGGEKLTSFFHSPLLHPYQQCMRTPAPRHPCQQV